MRTTYFITMDTHGRTSEACVKTTSGKIVRREGLATTIPELRRFIESVPRPRKLAFEEGPMAGWLYRNLREVVNEVVVCDPRRNRLVAKEGDKDDPIDAGKLNDLYRGGFLKAVRQSDSAEKACYRQLVGLYHDQVEERVEQGNRIIALAKRYGIIITHGAIADRQAAGELAGRMSQEGATPTLVDTVLELWSAYQRAMELEEQFHARVVQATKQNEFAVRLEALPGFGWIRAATWLAYLETPWRFHSKESLWKYLGIGLTRETSGDGPVILRVEQACNRRLRAMIVGAAHTAIQQQHNPFAWLHGRWRESGLSARNARRNVARRLAGVGWGMWKSGNAYEPDRVWTNL